MIYKVLITTSGLGSRLGDFTKYTNKALIRIKDKPIIAYIIDQYSKSTNFIITLGYFGDQVKQFLKLAYPDRKFTFVTVDKYKGPGSSLLYSMLQARKFLNTPFIFHAADTLITEKIPLPSKNWIGGYKGEDSSQYASFDILGGRIERMYEKGMINPDYLHIGLVGIKDHKSFWKFAEEIHKENPKSQGLSDVHVIIKMIKSKLDFEFIEFKEWLDTGNVQGLLKAIRTHEDSSRGLDKVGEATFFMNGRVFKFFYNEKIIEQRVERVKSLKNFVPKLDKNSKNFISYKYINGETVSDILNRQELSNLIKWLEKSFWKRKFKLNEQEFQLLCMNFYKTKTNERISEFFKLYSIEDKLEKINNIAVPSLREILKRVDFQYLSKGIQSSYHGDMVLENIIKPSNKKGYILLDWRQSFGGDLEVGDRYYDLAKLNHNLIINHDIVNRNLFNIEVGREEVKCDILRKDRLVESQKLYLRLLSQLGYDVKKVKILTALIWLNMASLHQHPFNLFLFYFGKMKLWEYLNEEN